LSIVGRVHFNEEKYQGVGISPGGRGEISYCGGEIGSTFP